MKVESRIFMLIVGSLYTPDIVPASTINDQARELGELAGRLPDGRSQDDA
jgi:hypothetical protein